jgi:hypothetical protein
MLKVACVDYVEDPIETQDRVYNHGSIIVIGVLVATDIAKEALVGVRLEKRPIHKEVPDS